MTCRTCEWVQRRDRGEAPSWDAIFRTAHWDVAHCAGTRHEGWLVVVTREHRDAVADLTDDEVAELGPLLRLTSRALHDVTGAVKTYAAQFAEHPLHPHVHFHVIPRLADHPEATRGPRVFGSGDNAGAVVPEARMDEIAERVRSYLVRHESHAADEDVADGGRPSG